MINVHVSRLHEYPNWVIVGSPNKDRFEIVDPVRTCVVRTVNGLCRLDRGHRGYHSVAVFSCDSCGRTVRLPAEVSNENVTICFPCTKRRYR